METFLFILTTVGFLLSLYGFVVGQRMKSSGSYKPLCDFNDHVSCSKAFTSPEGSLLLFVPNTLLGVFFYPILGFLIVQQVGFLALFLSSVSVVVSLYLLSVLIRQRNFCIVCIMTYVVNIAIFYGLVVLL